MGISIAVTPHECETIASMFEVCAENHEYFNRHYAAAHDYNNAARWFTTAAAASIGHKRTARYESAAERCRDRARNATENHEATA